MNEIIKKLKSNDNKFQKEALKLALNHKEEINDILYQELEEYINNLEETEDSAPMFITYAILLLADAKDSRLYNLLIKLFNKTDIDIECLFDDGLIDRLDALIAHIFNKDFDSYNNIIENKEVNPFVRYNFILGYTYLYQDKLISKEELETYLRKVIKLYKYDEEESEIYEGITDVIKYNKLDMDKELKAIYKHIDIFDDFLINDTQDSFTPYSNAIDEIRRCILF